MAVKRDPQVAKLAAQLLKSQTKLGAIGGSVPQTHPSIISRVFDVISRPNYAVASAFDNVVNKINENKAAGKGGNLSQLPGLLTGGLATGIEGKTKTRFGDVLAHGGVNNRAVRAVGGLAADIALDPTTYAGIGLTKAVPNVEAASEAGHAIEAARGPGVKADYLANLADQGFKDAKAAKPGSISLKVAGRPVAESTRLYDALAKVGRPIAETGPVDTLSRLFRTRATFPGELNSLRRSTEQAGISSYLEREKALLDKFRKLSPEAGAQVSRATEKGVDLTGTIKDGIDLGDLQKHWLDLKQHYDTLEQANGVFRPGQGFDQYVPKKFASTADYRSAEAERFRAMEQTAHSALSAGKKGAFPTFDELKNVGLKPHENMIDVARLRAVEGERAVAKATFKNKALDEMAVEFPGKGKKAAEDAARLSGMEHMPANLLNNTLHKGRDIWVPKELKRSFETLDRLYTSTEESQKFLRFFDSVSRLWKTGVTTINPVHHARNMVGDVFNAWEAGVNSPLDVERAGKVLARQGQLKLGNAAHNAFVDASELNDAYKLTGGASGFFNTELVGPSTPGTALSKGTGLLNRGQEALRNTVAKREDLTRMLTWTHAVREYTAEHGYSGLHDLEDAAKYATEKVKKFHFDYGDLTHFESNVRRVVPFYTYMRKNLPLQLEMIAMNPGKISKVPKGFQALQQLLGTDTGHLPISEVVPAYIKDLAGIRVRGENNGGNAMYLDPQLPITQAAQLFTGSREDILRKALGQTVVRPVAELGFGRSTLTGQPISRSLPDYAANQFPWSRTALQHINPHQPNRVVLPGEKGANKLLKLADLVNPVSVREITPQAQRSELQRQLDPVQARLRSERLKRINKAIRSRR